MTTVASAFVAAAANRSDSTPRKLGFRSLETEIAEARALEVRGTMPKELSGVLYRRPRSPRRVRRSPPIVVRRRRHGPRARDRWGPGHIPKSLRCDTREAGRGPRDQAPLRGLPYLRARRTRGAFSPPQPSQEPGEHQHRLPRREAPGVVRVRTPISARPRCPRYDGRGRHERHARARRDLLRPRQARSGDGRMWNFGASLWRARRRTGRPRISSD
jgi:hypothetical protein